MPFSPPRKLLAGIIFIVAGIMLFLLPFTGIARDTRLVDHTIHDGEINPLFGYQLYPETTMPKKLQLKLSNMTDGLKVRLVLYIGHTEDINPGDGYVLGSEKIAQDGKTSITFTELSIDGLSAIAFKGATTYYIEAVSEDQRELVGVVVKFVVTSFIPSFIGIILFLVGIILLASFYLTKESTRKGKVPFYEELPEPSLPGSTARKSIRRKKTTKKRKVAAVRSEKAPAPSIRAQKCPKCGANVPSGQMYCPSCYAKV